MIQQHHLQEWLNSGVSPELIDLNVRSVDGQEAIELILSDAIAQRQKVQYVTAGTNRLLAHYSHLEAGGWWVSGLDPLNNWEPMEWGQLKPDAPRHDPYKPGKPIKYEQPLKVGARCLFLRQPLSITLKTAIYLGIKYGQKFAQEIDQEIERVRSLSRPQNESRSADGGEAISATGRETNCKESISGRLAEIQFACRRGEYGEALRLFRAVWDRPECGPTQSGYVHSGRVERLELENSNYWHWIQSSNLPITLTEGAKKAQSMMLAGVCGAIAVPGITMGAKTDSINEFRLHPDLEVFATPGREINLCFDYETRFKTIHAIERETEKLAGLFRKAGCEFRVVELPGPEKGADDFIVARGEDEFHRIFDQRLTLDRWQAKRLSRLSYPATITLNQRYLGELDLPEQAKLVLLKSPKGTGKTESFKQIVASATERGQRVLLISHRVQLAQAICDRVRLPYITELKTAEEGALLGYGLCIDSLHPESQARFNAEYWHDAVVIIDEVEQVIWHLLDAKTEVASKRTTVLEQLKQLLLNTVESEHGKIILADADLSNQSLDFVWGLLDEKVKPHIILNRWKPETEAWQVYHYNQRKADQWLAGLQAEIEGGGKPFVITQSQKAKSLWGTTTLERNLKRCFPGLKVLRIDSETIADPSHAAYLCTAKLNELAARYDCIIASPSIETGVSIDVRRHFTSVWGCLNGVSPENSARQFLARLRDPVDRHIWIAPRGIGTVGNGSASVKAILKAEYQVAKVTAKLVQTISYNEEMLGAFSVSLKAWAKMAARINAGLVRYRDCVLDGLRQEGHSIHDWHPGMLTRELIDELKEDRDQGHLEACEAVASAELIEQKKYDELKGKKAKTPQERYMERKFQIHNRYQIEVTSDLVAKDDDGWYPKLRLFYFIGVGKVFLKERDEQSLDNALKTSGPWLPTLNRSQLSTRVWLLEQLGVLALLNLDEEFYGGTKSQDYENASPALLKLRDLAIKHSWEVKCGLGVTVSEKMSPIQIAQTILGKLGIKLQFKYQVGRRGDRQRVYRYELPKDGRDEILAGWFSRDESARQQAVHTPGIDLRDQRGAA